MTTETPNGKRDADHRDLWPHLNRRGFLKHMGLVGGGILVYGTVGLPAAWTRTPRTGYIGGKVPTDFNAFLRIGADNRVTCFVGKIEMGQGPITSFAQMLAEELEVAYEAVDMVMGDTQRCPWDAGTWGSLSTRYYGVFVKEAACEARGVLKALAAEKLGCPAARLMAEKGVLYDRQNPAVRVPYGELTAGKIVTRHLKDLPPLKPASAYTISGKPYLRRDARDKVTGRARFTADVRLPGMVYARILRPPAHGARLIHLDTSAAEKMRDVEVVHDGDLVAVLHPDPDGAARALAAIQADFDLPKTGVDHDTIFSYLVENAPEPVVAGQAGSLATGRRQAVATLERTYTNSYVAHAPMEPHAALASIQGDQITLWASTQSPFGVQEQVARTLGWPMEKVRVITPFVGGGFGGKSASEQAMEAAARQFGWISSKTPSGRGWGIACGIDAETYVATMAEVAVDRGSGEIEVKRVVCAQDMGLVVNPQGATIQMEGCITMGLGYALSEEMHFSDGRLLDVNFDTYNIPRFSWLPEIETIIVPNPDLPPKGGGEPAIVCMGGVLATAVHDATGVLIDQLPMTPERVKSVLAHAAAA